MAKHLILARLAPAPPTVEVTRFGAETQVLLSPYVLLPSDFLLTPK